MLFYYYYTFCNTKFLFILIPYYNFIMEGKKKYQITYNFSNKLTKDFILNGFSIIQLGVFFLYMRRTFFLIYLLVLFLITFYCASIFFNKGVHFNFNNQKRAVE